MCHIILFSQYNVIKSFIIRSICFLRWVRVWKKREWGGEREAGMGMGGGWEGKWRGLGRGGRDGEKASWEVLIFRWMYNTVLMIIFTIITSCKTFDHLLFKHYWAIIKLVCTFFSLFCVSSTSQHYLY